MTLTGPDLWPFVVILIAGWLATDIWRWMGVLLGNRLKDDSELLNWVRAVATSLVAAVIAKQILYPNGVLEGSSVWLRIASASFGFLLFVVSGKRVVVGVLVAMAVLATGLWASGF